MPRLVLVLLAVLSVTRTAAAQTDEIQVYDGGLRRSGRLQPDAAQQLHAEGHKTPAFPGAVVADDSFNGVPEWAYGVTQWFEAGLYLPLYSHDQRLGWGIDGFKLRTLFAVPNADDRRFFYGVNFEFSYNARALGHERITSEIRPIIGWHSSRGRDRQPDRRHAYDGLENLEFVPATRDRLQADRRPGRSRSRSTPTSGRVSDILRERRARPPGLFGVVDYAARWSSTSKPASASG